MVFKTELTALRHIYAQYPINDKAYNIQVPEFTQNSKGQASIISNEINVFLKKNIKHIKIEYISNSFYDKFMSSINTIKKIGIKSIVVEFIKYIAIPRLFIFKDEEIYSVLAYSAFNADGSFHSYDLVIYCNGVFMCVINCTNTDTKIPITYYCYENSKKIDFYTRIQQIIKYLIVFKKHIPVENKIINPKQKIKTINCKYLNTTQYPIEIIDSRWFTDLVVSGKFNVRGHFRFQPCGQGLAEKKIIWITDYTKQGYTLKNRKENKQ